MTEVNTLQLSEKQLRARLNKETLNHPVTLSTGVIGILAVTAATLFSTSNQFLTLAAVSGCALAGCAGFIVNRSVIGRHKAMLAIIEKVRAETRAKRELISESTQNGLSEFHQSEALHQLGQLKEKFDAFNMVLNLQFDDDEMAHGRYLTTAEQLYFGAVDNLRSYMVLCHSIRAIDVAHIQNQLKQKDLPADARHALSERLTIHTHHSGDGPYSGY